MRTAIAPLTVVVAIVVVAVTLALSLSRAECGQVETVTNRDTRWGMWSGCYVQVDDGGRYVPLDTWRTPEEAP